MTRPVAKGPPPTRRKLFVRTIPVKPAPFVTPLIQAQEAFDDDAVTRSLIAEGLYLENSRELFGRTPDSLLSEDAPAAQEMTLPSTAELLTDPVSLVEFLFQVGTDPLIWGRAHRDPSVRLQASSLHFYGQRPESFEMAWIENLLSSSEFEDMHDELPAQCRRLAPPAHFLKPRPELEHGGNERPYEPKFFLAALLIARGITREEDLEMVLPAFRYREFHRYQAQVYAEIRKRLPAIADRFRTFWATLTDAQRIALEETYMIQGVLDSKPVVAKRLGISPNSLRDRLQGALKKLRHHFPEWRPLRKGRARSTKRDRLYDGFLWKSAVDPVPFRQLDSRTGAWTLRRPTQAPKIVTEQVGFAEHLGWIEVTTPEA